MTVPVPSQLQLRLAHALLNKAARSQGTRGVRLRLDAAVLPELHQATHPDQARRVELELESLCAAGWVMLKLDKALPFQTLADRHPALLLVDAGALAAWAGYEAPVPAWSRELVQALKRDGELCVPDRDGLLAYLLRNPLPAFMDLPAPACTRILNELAAACAGHQPLSQAPLPTFVPVSYLRELSAHCFLGHSKVLDNREELLRLLGARPGRFAESPVQLLVRLPARPFHSVLLIENLVTFEHMGRDTRTAWSESALVYSSGFKGAARRLRTRIGSSVYWTEDSTAASRAAFDAWLYNFDESSAAATLPIPTRFFGDLDFAGLSILKQLRQVFPGCTCWPHGYQELLKQLRAGHSHRPEDALKTGQLDPGETGCELADAILLPSLRHHGRFVDQESATLWA